MLIHRLRKHTGRICLLLPCLAPIAPAAALEQNINVDKGTVTAMSEREARIDQVIAHHRAGRLSEALALLETELAGIEREAAPSRTHYFMPMFQLGLLVDDYPPARAAMTALRDAQAARLLAGEPYTGTDPAPTNEPWQRVERFSLILEMNKKLGDARSTYDIFRQLQAQQPALADENGGRALEAMVAMGDFALADRYRRPPLGMLDEVNLNARSMPLFPPGRQAPRLSADLMNLVRDVRIGMAVLRGLDDPSGSDALRAAMLDGLESAELKDLARRELDEPGTVVREVVAHQMAEEDRQRAL